MGLFPKRNIHGSQILGIVSRHEKRRRSKENSAYQVTVSGLEGLIDGFSYLAGLRLPGTKPKLTRERSVELEQTDPGSEVPWKRRAGRRPTGW